MRHELLQQPSSGKKWKPKGGDNPCVSPRPVPVPPRAAVVPQISSVLPRSAVGDRAELCQQESQSVSQLVVQPLLSRRTAHGTDT